VEAVADDPFCCETKRDRQQLCDARHGVVKGGIEAGDLHGSGEMVRGAFHQRKFERQMLGVEWHDAAQRIDLGRADPLRAHEVGTAMDDAMSDGAQSTAGGLPLGRSEHQFARCPVVCCHRFHRRRGGAGHRRMQARIGRADTIDGTRSDPNQRTLRREQRELDARRAAVQRQDDVIRAHDV
jgi:hypothetical protein